MSSDLVFCLFVATLRKRSHVRSAGFQLSAELTRESCRRDERGTWKKDDWSSSSSRSQIKVWSSSQSKFITLPFVHFVTRVTRVDATSTTQRSVRPTMPHQKRLTDTEDFGFGEGGAFSPDGKWYGPLQDDRGFFFLASDGQRLPIKLDLSERVTNALWSPDGRYVQIKDKSNWQIVDMQTLRAHEVQNVSDGNICESKCRWNPWSKRWVALNIRA
ncbi:MAG: hypothetical protein V7638_3448 [Acidobacteriota bacterium]